MKQTYENNKRRIQAFKLTADLKDDNGVVHHFVDGYEYVEIGGLKWATCNIGAENETDGGLYFAWGETKGYKDANKKYFLWDDYELMGEHLLKYSRDDGLTTLEACDDAATQNMGRNWRMPTKEDFITLLSSTTKKWTAVNGVNGRLLTDKADESKKLFFPTVGNCDYGRVYSVGSYCLYWSSSLSMSSVCNGSLLFFGGASCGMSHIRRCNGLPVRGVIK